MMKVSFSDISATCPPDRSRRHLWTIQSTQPFNQWAYQRKWHHEKEAHGYSPFIVRHPRGIRTHSGHCLFTCSERRACRSLIVFSFRVTPFGSLGAFRAGACYSNWKWPPWWFHLISGKSSLFLVPSLLNRKNHLQRDLPIRTKRKLHAIGGARGMWSLPIRQPVKASGISYERAVNPYQAEDDTLIISTDINPSPGLSRVVRISIQEVLNADPF